MSHRNTPSKTKGAPAKRAKKPAKLEKGASGSTRGGTKQETVLGLLKQPKAADTVASLARQTGDGTRDLPPSTREVVRRAFPQIQLDAKSGDASMSRIFGEELPSGLVFDE